jgi:hypothetical protein
MPYAYVFQCDRCAYDVEISICREFRREADGRPVNYEYPQPDLYEWPVKRISGLWSTLWCPACRAVRPRVVVELEEPAEHPVQAFLAAEGRGYTGMETGPCPVCSGPLELEAEAALCPGCGEGRLQLIGEYEP